MHATTCARSSALIFFRWYARSSWRSSRFKNATHARGDNPIKNCPSIAPRGGRGLGGRQPSSPPSAPGTYAAVSKEPVPVARSNAPRFPAGFFFPEAPRLAAASANPPLASRFSRLRPEDLDECDFECAFAFPSPLGRFHSLPSTAALSLSRYAAATSVLYFSRAGVVFATPYFSKNFLCLSLPPARIAKNCAAVHVSIVAERTNETCTPRLRCTPEQFRQRKMPCLMEHQSGLDAAQSAHV